MIKKKNFLICVLVIIGGLAMINPMLAYKKLPFTVKASEYVGKKVSFEGRFSNIPNQHMIASSDTVPHKQSFYIDPAPEYKYLDQMVGYYNGNVLLDVKKFKDSRVRFYGEFVLIEGETKKGDGQHWSEWGFAIHDAEGLWGKSSKW